ncbi:MAG: 3-deoxy-7-phosphoheptulonate synthase [Nitrospirae bacterium]|nr:3-deoxy-7-phosphoheptulonate synthase [Nitrospirota bacterium]
MYEIDVNKNYELVKKSGAKQKTVIRVGNVEIGGDGFTVMAGPCTVESLEQIVEIAKEAKKAGAHLLRGGAFKPCTFPYRFMGHGEDGLKMLAEARSQTGLPIVTEVMEPSDVDVVCKYADILQIGMRNMQNYRLLHAVSKTDKPVLLKRGSWAKLDEWLGAAEYIAAGGNEKIILCERGIVSFEDHTRWTLSLSVVPALKEITHLPIIVDPSHGTGRRNFIIAMAKAGAAAGADGLMIEVHPVPDKSFSDAIQTLGYEDFNRLMRDLAPVVKAVGRNI